VSCELCVAAAVVCKSTLLCVGCVWKVPVAGCVWKHPTIATHTRASRHPQVACIMRSITWHGGVFELRCTRGIATHDDTCTL
jgi:hypothetical protein